MAIIIFQQNQIIPSVLQNKIKKKTLTSSHFAYRWRHFNDNKLLLLTDQQMDRTVLPRNAHLRLREFASSERWLLNARPSNPPPICTRVKYAFTHVLPMPNKHFVGRLVIMIQVLLPFDEFPTDTLRSINITNARK